MRVGYLRCRACAGAATYSIAGKALDGGYKADEWGETRTHEGRDTHCPAHCISRKQQ
jgi:hypothetical protein